MQIRLSVKTSFRVPKQGVSPEECGDAFAYFTVNGQSWRLAVADGSSETLFSGRWAQILVEGFIAEPPDSPREELQSWLDPLAAQWNSSVLWEQLPWFAERKARRGADATLLGLVIERAIDSPNRLTGKWSALAVGDVCLFQIRDDELLIAFPLNNWRDFGRTPLLLGTLSEYNPRTIELLAYREGNCVPGDTFILASDELAKWFLRSHEAKERPWRMLQDLNSTAFQEFIDMHREQGTMRDDDVTLLIVVAEEEPATVQAQPEDVTEEEVTSPPNNHAEDSKELVASGEIPLAATVVKVVFRVIWKLLRP